MSIFSAADILVPQNVDLKKWSVVACDQYTSQKDYWERVKSFVGEAPSSLNLIYPEAYLSEGESRIKKINSYMEKYLNEGIFKELKNSYVYVRRTLSGKRVRKGIIGAVDLEEYDFSKGSKSAVRATEGTVPERIPPRVKIRKDAPLELPHVMLLTDDREFKIFPDEPAGEKIYDFELMENGGHLEGYVISGKAADDITEKFNDYAKNAKDGLVLAVGDGNHSLATAKTCWENLKKNLSPEEQKNHPARFCLVEMENIYDEALEFEPIHRVLFNVDPKETEEKLKAFYPETSSSENGGHKITLISENGKKDLYIKNSGSKLAVGAIQKFIDYFGYETDYIHGGDTAVKLGSEKGNLGIILPKPEKSDLFETVIADGALPRKTFSMGEANEKRFYLEAKKIK